MALARIKGSLAESDRLFTKLLDKGRKGASSARYIKRMARHEIGEAR